MKLQFLSPIYSVCQFAAANPIPDWAIRNQFLAIVSTDDELTVVADSTTVPEGTKSQGDFSCFRVATVLDFDQVGVIAKISQALADAEIPILSISTFNTDYFLVSNDQREKVQELLIKAGYEFLDDASSTASVALNRGGQPVVTEQVFDVSAARLWAAITERDQMVEWFFAEIPEFKAETGFKTQFNIDAGERQFLHLWEIIDAVPSQKIVYDWRYEGYPGVGKVTFEVSEEDEGSRLRVTSEGAETFPQDIPEFKRESAVDGWQYLIQESLPNYLKT